MSGPLIAYDRSGGIVAALDFLVAQDADGAYRLVDFVSAEEAGVRLRSVWEVSGAAGSTTWPEFLGHRFHEFRVELDHGHPLRGRRLVHRGSGHTRHRDAIEADIERRKQSRARAGLRRLDASPIVGNMLHPLILDDHGRTLPPERDDDAERVRPAFHAHLR